MAEDKVQVLQLAGAPKVFGTGAQRDPVEGTALPASDDFDGPPIFRRVTRFQEQLRDPGTAELILLSELSACASADDGDGRMARVELSGRGAIVAEAGDVNRL